MDRFPGHFLITESIEHDESACGQFKTAPVLAIRSAQPCPPRAVTPLVKRDPVSYLWMITIGRTRNNDIVQPDISVSKLHALICRQTDRSGVTSFNVADAGSRNGTFVNDVPLRGQTSALPLGAYLRLGRVELVFVDAAMLYHAMVNLRTPAAPPTSILARRL